MSIMASRVNETALLQRRPDGEALPPNGKDPGWYDYPAGSVARRV